MPILTAQGNVRTLSRGSYPRSLIRAGSIDSYRAAAPLPLHAEELIDRQVTQVGLERLAVVSALIQAGLVYPLPNWLSVPHLIWQKQSKFGKVVRTMVPKARRELSMPDYGTDTLPVYCTIGEWSLGERELAASERAGSPLDVSIVAQLTRRSNESIEEAAIFGWVDDAGTAIKVVGNSAPGLLNAPHANTMVYESSGLAWDSPSKTGAGILADVLTMVGVLQGDHYYGPYTLFIPTTYGNALNADFKANSALTIYQRLKELIVGGSNTTLNIVVADRLPANKTAMVQMTDNVVDVVMGQTPAAISWEDGLPFESNGAIISCVVPRFKSDYEGSSGIVIGYTS